MDNLPPILGNVLVVAAIGAALWVRVGSLEREVALLRKRMHRLNTIVTAIAVNLDLELPLDDVPT
ncbi:MAG: hypothetical protein ACREMV_15080 [Gemmatimonadales bacterium]